MRGVCWRWVLAGSFALSAGVAWVGSALAQDAGPLPYSGRVDVNQFVPAPEGVEQVSAPLMVTLAYGFIWLFAVAFLFSIWRRSRALGVELDAARQRLSELDARLAERLQKDAKGGGKG